MVRVIINSYTCCPNMGSEPGMGWNWIINLAKYCEVYVISEGEFRPQIEAWMAEQDARTTEALKIDAVESSGWYSLRNEEWQGKVCFYWNAVSPNVRRMCWNQGDWRFYHYYEKWQRKTADIARRIVSTDKIDILHQLNMIGFREPGYLWRVSKETSIPFVWGPVDAKGSFPMAYTEGAPIKNILFLRIKNLITNFQLHYGCRVHKAAQQASIILGANSNSVRNVNASFNKDCVLMNETGCSILMPREKNETKNDILLSEENKCKTYEESFHKLSLLWVGKFDFRKQLSLAIRVIEKIKNLNVCLHIVGDGDVFSLKKQIANLEIEDKIILHGLISHSAVQNIMQKTDALFFTSVAEGTPHVVLEAVANGLPIVCFDTCGQGDVVTEDIGIKIPLSTPSQSIKEFAEQIEFLYNHPEALQRMSDNCNRRAEQLSWDNKVKQLVKLYESVI